MKTALKKILEPYGDIVRYKEPLSEHTSFHIGGRAEALVRPKNPLQMAGIYKLCRMRKISLHILGRGTNILVCDDGVKGVVLQPEWMSLERKGNEVVVSPFYPLARLIMESSGMGLSGLEPLVGIPGSVAGAVVMNAGGKYGQMADVVKSVRIITKDGRIKTVNKIRFAYRWSNLKERLITEVTLQLKPSTSAAVRSRIGEILREKKQSQPLSDWSAGCVFANPASHRVPMPSDAGRFVREHRSAGALIDRAGLKGLIVGGAKISPKHANFIVNTGQAKARDVIKLIDIVRKMVKKKFRINLGLEIETW